MESPVLEINTRTAQVQDLERIVEIYNSTVPTRMVTADTEPVTVESRNAWFRAHSSARPLWIVETDAKKIAGWVSFQSFYGRPAYNSTAEISIYLDPSFRAKGLGKKILRFSIEKCPELKINTLMGFIFAHNEPSLRLFKGQGFEQWGYLPDIAVLDAVKRSVVILGKRLAP